MPMPPLGLPPRETLRWATDVQGHRPLGAQSRIDAPKPCNGFYYALARICSGSVLSKVRDVSNPTPTPESIQRGESCGGAPDRGAQMVRSS